MFLIRKTGQSLSDAQMASTQEEAERIAKSILLSVPGFGISIVVMQMPDDENDHRVVCTYLRRRNRAGDDVIVRKSVT